MEAKLNVRLAGVQDAIGIGNVAVVQGEVIGFAQFIIRENRCGELTRIYVLPGWQHGLTEALTTDHHFEQAGLTRLLKSA